MNNIENIKNKIEESTKIPYEWAIFKDKSDNLELVSIYEVPDICLELESYNQEEEKTGYIKFYFDGDNIKLIQVYCYDKFRGLGIASNLSKLSDYLLQKYDGKIIIGDFIPKQIYLEKNIEKDKEELKQRAYNFYKNNGYDFKSNNKNDVIVFKDIIKKDLPFSIIDGYIVNDNAKELINTNKKGL